MRRLQWPCFGLLSISLLFVWLNYAQAVNLTWQFDDYLNLKLLSQASSHAGLFDFVFGGTAGPLGRPLSLISFLPNYADWTGNPWGVVRLNILIHCFNGLMVYAIAIRLLGEDEYLQGAL